MKTAMTRRAFLGQSSLVIAGVVLASRIDLFNASPVFGAKSPFKPHAFLEIGSDDSITVWVGQTNLGQGTHTGIAMIIVDELNGAWENVTVKMALAAEPFKSPVWHMQATGGSSSIRHRWDLFRTVGAAARQMLLEAAAEQWGIAVSECVAGKGKVIHPDGRSITYGELAERAGRRPIPEQPQWKSATDYTLIGSSPARLDLVDKVTGKTVYGIDFSIDNMCIAVVARPPRFGAKPTSYNGAAAMAVHGVLKVVPLDGRIAVCAQTTYSAMKGRQALNVQWSEGTHPGFADEQLDAALQDLLGKPGAIAQNDGDVEKALAAAKTTLQQTYSLPYLSHAQVEPINCTAHVEKERCRIWVPTQGQTATQQTAARLTGLPPEKVEVMTLPAGGGFGLRGEQDAVIDAVSLSQAMNRPVKVVWSREDDFANDYFRPANRSRLQAGLDDSGKVTCWSHKVAAPSVMSRLMPQSVEGGIDPDAISGIRDMVYTFAAKRVEYVLVDLPVQVGFWRSVGYSANTFTVESFMDELANAAGQDPVAFRLAHLEKDTKPYNVLKLLAEKGGWNIPVPQGRARGVALGACFESVAAHMAEVSVDKDGRITVHKMHFAIDCGTAVYPDAIRAQAEAGVVMGMSTAFHEKIHFRGGGVQTANYDEYRVLRMSEVPEIEVHIAASGGKAGGIGEPVFPTVAPAIANAVFRATGVRLRDLPFRTELLAKG
jgi:isoquinoline 1-oxidoreductase beta subunit